jgi:hypothetical protein
VTGDQASERPLAVRDIEVKGQIDRRIRHNRRTKTKTFTSKISSNKETKLCKHIIETRRKIFHSVGIRRFLERWDRHVGSQGKVILH